MPWEYFDKFYCISIEERADRRADAKVQFKKVGLADKVEFVIVRKHPHNCEEGIYYSHMACIKKGLQAGADTIVIFEDDILFDRFSPAGLKNCINFLSGTDHWNALFFGCLVSDSKKTENKSVLRVKYRCLAHGYVLNRQFAKLLVTIPWQEIPYDYLLNSFAKGYYSVYPSFAFQSSSRTDNDKKMGLDRFRRLFGGLRRIQKWNEFYHRYKILVITAHIILLLIILNLFFLIT
ncbi:MAG: glycosyltransferase family 25 protein [Desulfobacterales bacterium]|jgi:GR25 family glycosyltransferase involved in LPS biosynthesis